MAQHTASARTTDSVVPAAASAVARSAELPPRPERRPLERSLFGETVTVPYRWLRETRSPEVQEHFAAENAFTDARTAHVRALRERLESTAVDPTPSIALSTPVLVDGWWYIDRSSPADGATLSRVRDDAALRGDSGVPEIVPGRPLEGEEVLVEDCLSMISFTVSQDHSRVARAEAAPDGCHVIVTDAATGAVLDDAITGAGPDLAFSADGRTLLHTRLDDLDRRFQLRRHTIGGALSEDEVLLEEADDFADLELVRSRDRSAALVSTRCLTGSEVWLVDLADPELAPRSLTGRCEATLQAIEHAGDRLLALHTDPGTGRTALSEAPLDAADLLRELTPVLVAAEGEHFTSVEAFAGAIALELRGEGVPRLRVLPRRADGSVAVDRAQEVGRGRDLDAVQLEATPGWEQTSLRYRLDSFLTPPSLYEHDIATGTSRLLGRAETVHDLEDYVERRLWATSDDGTRVPLSVIARADVAEQGDAPGFLWVEGAYGATIDPLLTSHVLTLADHGLVVAFAHVRGGAEMGRPWHLAGRRLAKPNGIADLLACAEHLTRTGWVDPRRLGAGSTGAGSMLVAAAANRSPQTFRALMVGAPMVDPLETILHPDVMLTLEEWAEWGDPGADPRDYHCMRSYTPAENTPAAEYPAVFAWTAFEGVDTPAACAAVWIATLRDTVTSDREERPLLLRTVQAPGGTEHPRLEGMAWLLDQLGATTLRG